MITSHVFSPPKAHEAFTAITDKLRGTDADYQEAKENSRKAAAEFLRIKNQRTKRFMDAFNHVDKALKTIYTDMTKSSKHPLGGKAYLSLDDTEEPFKGGLKFNAMPPMKRFRDMYQLSGGEKTVASLALLFAIHSFHPAPFFVMDEVDAALDNSESRCSVDCHNCRRPLKMNVTADSFSSTPQSTCAKSATTSSNEAGPTFNASSSV
jgi:chromosome segregation ATPase